MIGVEANLAAGRHAAQQGRDNLRAGSAFGQPLVGQGKVPGEQPDPPLPLAQHCRGRAGQARILGQKSHKTRVIGQAQTAGKVCACDGYRRFGQQGLALG